jgi:hypothetical protein
MKFKFMEEFRMKRKIIALSLTLLLCAAPAGSVFAVETNAASGGGAPGFEEIWSISNVLSSNELGGNGDHYFWTVYYTDAPATVTVVALQSWDGTGVTKAEFKDGDFVFAYDPSNNIAPTSGKLESFVNDEYDTPLTFWRYTVGSVLTLEEGVYAFYNDGPAQEGFFVVVGESAVPTVTPPTPAPVLTAKPTAGAVLVNGEQIAFDAYNISGNNYFKLRDLAYVLNGTEKQFDVGWDGNNNRVTLTGGKPYTSVGGEMAGKGAGDKTPTPTSSDLSFNFADYDGPIPNFGFTAYNIDGNNYFKLRDIAYAFNFGVDWDGARNTIIIDTGKGYTPE